MASSTKGSGWLAEADAALRGGDPRKALNALLPAWRELRSPAIAETIEDISALVTKDAAALVGKRLKDKVEAWNTRAKAANPADFGVLAQNLFLVNSGKEVGAHLEQLGEWPADPRLSSLLHELALKVPFTATSAKPFWRALFGVLSKVGDPRTPAALDAADENFVKAFEGRDDFLTYLPNQTKKVRAAIVKVAAQPLDEATNAALSAMRAFIRERAKPTRGAAQLSSLLDAVYDDPIADAPREVLADALLETSDPRGEFLSLQMAEAHGRTLSRDEKRREKVLLDEHVDAWLGPLAGWIRKGDRAFRRGFLSRCTIEQKGRNAGPFPDVPAWATVEDATAVQPLEPAALRRLRGARRVSGVSFPALIESSQSKNVMPNLAEVLALGHYEPTLFGAIGDAPGLPALRRLRFVFRGMAGAPRPDVPAFLSAFQRLQHLTWLRVQIEIDVDRPGHLSDSMDIALAREGSEVVAHVRLHADAGIFEAYLRILDELGRRAPFIARTKITAWEYDSYFRGMDPTKELEKRVPIRRLRESRLNEVELEVRGESADEVFAQQNLVI